MGNSGGSLADCEYPRRKRRSSRSAYFPASTLTFGCIAVSGSSIRISSEAAVRQRGRHSPGAVARGLRRLENNALPNCVRQSLRPPGPIRCIHLGTVPMKGPQRAVDHARVTSCSEPHAAHEHTPGLPGFAGPCEMVKVCLVAAVSWTRNGASRSEGTYRVLSPQYDCQVAGLASPKFPKWESACRTQSQTVSPTIYIVSLPECHTAESRNQGAGKQVGGQLEVIAAGAAIEH